MPLHTSVVHIVEGMQRRRHEHKKFKKSTSWVSRCDIASRHGRGTGNSRRRRADARRICECVEADDGRRRYMACVDCRS